jgi:hypothetical protein
MRLKLLAVLILVALQFSCSAPVVRNVEVTAGTCMTWQTNQPARCRVICCHDNLCESSEWEGGFFIDHCLVIPENCSSIKIISLNSFNQRSDIEVRK